MFNLCSAKLFSPERPQRGAPGGTHDRTTIKQGSSALGNRVG